ncbi:tumor necrosis factor receptor superfamily member 21 [Cricetulus griseus]|uniref:Tumor necrosis factor receptor superfamily member 21 n=1 Tax=Cricetulus griseus TaxID=10029 RepID=A0A061IK30_CRIGR|nr:tumor necrosis factor receptor superfamily member 21 [Cricetulus griseus]
MGTSASSITALASGSRVAGQVGATMVAGTLLLPHPSIILCQPLRVVRGRRNPVSCLRPVVATALSLLQCHVRMLPQWRQRDRSDNCLYYTSGQCLSSYIEQE